MPEASLGFRVQILSWSWQLALQFRDNYKLKMHHPIQPWEQKESINKKDWYFCWTLPWCVRGKPASVLLSSLRTWVLASFFVQCHRGVWIFRSKKGKKWSLPLLRHPFRVVFRKQPGFLCLDLIKRQTDFWTVVNKEELHLHDLHRLPWLIGPDWFVGFTSVNSIALWL